MANITEDIDANALDENTQTIITRLTVIILITGVFGLFFNGLSIKTFKLMNKTVTFTFLDTILKFDTVRIILYMVASLMIQLGDVNTIVDVFESKNTVLTTLYTVFFGFVLGMSVICAILEMTMSLERCITIVKYHNRPNPPKNIFSHPKIISAIASAFAALLMLTLIIRFETENETFVGSAMLVLPVVFKLANVLINVAMVIAILRHYKDWKGSRMAQNGPAYLRYKHTMASARIVLAVTLISFFLSLPTLIRLVNTFKEDGQETGKRTSMMVRTFLTSIACETVSCINFICYIAFSKSFQQSLKKVLSPFLVKCCKRSNRTAPLVPLSTISQVTMAEKNSNVQSVAPSFLVIGENPQPISQSS